jgi:hypothetical protein
VIFLINGTLSLNMGAKKHKRNRTWPHDMEDLLLMDCWGLKEVPAWVTALTGLRLPFEDKWRVQVRSEEAKEEGAAPTWWTSRRTKTKWRSLNVQYAALLDGFGPKVIFFSPQKYTRTISSAHRQANQC